MKYFIGIITWSILGFSFIKADTILKPKFLFEFGKAGSGDGEFSKPKDIAFDFSGRAYVLDKERIQVFTSNGVYLTKFSSTNFVKPYALAIGRLGNIYVTDIEANCVHVFDKNFQYFMKFGSTGEKDGELYCPRQIAIGEAENVYVVDWHNHRVAKFNSVGGFLTNFVFSNETDIWGLTVDGQGDWLISCNRPNGNLIQRYNADGIFLSEISTKSENSGIETLTPVTSVLYDLVVYQNNFIIGSIEQFHTIHIYTATNYLTQFGALGKQSAQFNEPAGLAVTSLASDRLYVTDANNNRVQVFSFEEMTNFDWAHPVAPGGVYHSGDFTGDGFGDILVYRKGRRFSWFSFDGEEENVEQVAILNVADNHLMGVLDMSLPEDWRFLGSLGVRKTLVGNSLGIFSSLVFCRSKQFRLARYWVDPLLIQNELQEEKVLPFAFASGHVQASGDVDQDGNLDIILTQKQNVKVLLGPDYTNLHDIIGLPKKLPGRVRAMYHESDKDNVLVFQKGKKPGQGYFINSNFAATVGPPIPVAQRIRAMSGSIPVTQKRRTITMGSFMYQDPKIKGKRKFKVVGPR
ncbi:MAG: hypothetical protein K1X66_06420 [Verrucomicrobiae bacterium]|nr:hypothetical protein [Verrucomicrobiae bacterium]